MFAPRFSASRWMAACVLVVAAWGLLLSDAGHAQDAYGPIPDSLASPHAAPSLVPVVDGSPVSATVRLESQRLVVHDDESSTLYVHRVVTVHGREGRSAGRLVLPYDSFREIDDLDGRLLDADGEEITDLGDEHLSDRSASQGGSLYQDARIRIAKMLHDRYPYTVEYWYEIDYTSALHWPTWFPERSNEAIAFSQFILETPSSVSVRRSARGDVPTPTKGLRDGRTALRWRVTNRLPYRRAPYGPSWREQAPSLTIAPTSFVLADSRGDLSTWAGLGRWYHDLKRDRDTLPPGAAQEIRQLVDGASSRRDSVRRVYRHLQKTTRYVSVQLGIGGWQPFPASYVEERGYGDCKALTNYMEAALSAIDIPSYPVLIYRGMNPPPIDPDFPANTFNHVVLAVPVDADTLWLENTDQTAPFGHVAADIEDRYGLWVEGNNSRLVRTPASEAADNRQTRTATVDLRASGNGTASVTTVYTGNQQDRVRRALANASPRSREKWLRDRIDLPSFTLTSADFSDVDALRDTVRLPLTLRLPNYASKTGSRLFVQPNLMERWSTIPDAQDGPRSQRVEGSPYPFLDVDSIRYRLPEGFSVEALPDSVHVDAGFASYTATVEAEGASLLYRRRLVWREKSLPPDAYDDFREFLRTITRADNAQAVLVKQ